MNALGYFSRWKHFHLIIFLFLVNIWGISAQIAIGNKIPEISLQNSADSLVHLSSFKGKFILIDFWASWCGPCRRANKNLTALYKKHGGQKFEIVGISLDTDRTKWLKAIQKDKITYTRLIDPKGFDAKSAVQFGVELLPASYLVDPNGILLAINPKEEEIIQTLHQNK